MSAYSGEKPTIVNLYSGQTGPETMAEFGPDTDRGETDTFVTMARHITGALAQERALAQKLRRELAASQAAHAKAVSEIEAKLKDSITRGEQLKGELERSRSSEQVLQAHLKAQNDYLTKFRTHYDDTKASWTEWQHKMGLELQVAKSSLEHIRQRNAVLEAENAVGKKELEKASFELQRHKSALAEAWNTEKRAQALIGEHERLRVAAEELRTMLGVEKRRREDLEGWVSRERHEKQASASYAKDAYAKIQELQRKDEELRAVIESERKQRELTENSMKKERRDKQIALDYLKQAEARISELERALADFR